MITYSSIAELHALRKMQPGGGDHVLEGNPFQKSLWSRRQFLQRGAAVLGASAAAGLFPGSILGSGNSSGGHLPKQLSGGSPILKNIFGVDIPFYLPVETDPFAAVFEEVSDSSTIADFKGEIGVIEADGVNDPANSSDNEEHRWSCDIRYMKGAFIDRAGKQRYGTFGFF